MSDHKIHSSYSYSVFNNSVRKERINTALKKIAEQEEKPTGIIATGISGIAFAPILAYELNVDLVVVRKRNNNNQLDSHHASYAVEGLRGCGFENTLMIVDDLVCSGDTIRRIKHEVETQLATMSDVYATFLSYGILYERNCDVKRFDINFFGIAPEIP